jgi:succinoglycan biosynthesis transport protein ExoP
MELRRYLHVLRLHAVVVVIVIVAALGLGFATTSRTKMYQASATVFVGQKSIGVDNPITGAPQSDPIQAAELLSVTYARMITTTRTATLAVQATGVPRSPAAVARATSAAPVNSTTLLVIAVKDRDAGVAAVLANAEANALIGEIKQLQTGVSGAEQEPASVFEPATVPTAPVPTQLGRNMLLFGIIGIVAALGVAVVLEYLDVTVRGASDIEREIELPVLGTVPLSTADV